MDATRSVVVSPASIRLRTHIFDRRQCAGLHLGDALAASSRILIQPLNLIVLHFPVVLRRTEQRTSLSHRSPVGILAIHLSELFRYSSWTYRCAFGDRPAEILKSVMHLTRRQHKQTDCTEASNT